MLKSEVDSIYSQEAIKLFDKAEVGILRLNARTEFFQCNSHLSQLCGYTSEDELLASIPHTYSVAEWYVNPRDYFTLIDLLQTQGYVKGFECEMYRHKTQDCIWIQQDAWVVKDSEGNILYFDIIIKDITQEKQQHIFQQTLIQLTEDMLQRGIDEGFYQRLLEYAVLAIPDVQAGSIIIRKEDSTYQYVAALGYDLEILRDVHYQEHEIVANTVLEPLIVKDLHAINTAALPLDKLQKLRESGPLDKIKAMMSLPAMFDGQIVATLSLDTFDDKGFSLQSQQMAKIFTTQIGVILRRLSLEQELEQKNKELIQLANYDSLTLLPNRLLFLDRLEQSFAQARRTGNLVALVYLDLDGFKDVNDSLGHNMGDELLRAVSSRLSNQLREQDTIARLGGDEFAIVISSVKQAEDVAAIAQKILDCLTMSFNLKTYSIHIGASVGISLYPDDGLSVEDILKHADAAMYQAKHAGKNRYSFFTPQLNQHIIEQLKLENDMRHGLEHGEFFLHYQPRIHLSTKHIHSVEALLRWKHPVRGLISPGLFIPIAEKTGLILPLTKYVLYLAAAQAKAWLSEGRDLRVAINLSAKCFQHPDLIPMLQDTLNAHDLEAKYLELEITESAAMDDVESNITTLNQLRDMGFYIAIDDFGTAYSSLNYLKRLPVNCLKIDRSFIKDISFKTLDSVDTAIVKAIVALGKALDFHLVAEGVETLEQANFLQFLGCYEAQGFYFCKPLPASELFQAEQSVIELM